MKCNKEDILLYAVTDRSWLHGETLYSQVEKALKGGVTFLQIREKGLDEKEFLEEAKEIKELCKKYNVPLIINDNVDIALAIDADGIHVGQNDMEVRDARAKLGPDKIIGVSAHSVEEALLAKEQGADYLGAGAAFPTGTKGDAGKLDHDVLKQICQSVDIPVVAIGGIGKKNVMQLAGRGLSGVAIVSGIFAQPDIEGATRELRTLVETMVKA